MDTETFKPSFQIVDTRVNDPPNRARKTSPLALPLIIAALALGLAGDVLLNAFPWGINVFLFVLVLMGVIVFIARRYAIKLTGGGRWLALPAFAFAALYVLRDSNTVRFLCLLAVVVSLALMGALSRVGRVRIAALWAYVLAFVSAIAHGTFGAFILAVQDTDYKQLRLGNVSFRRFSGLLIGLLIALPLLLIFGSLFASADPAFNDLARRLFNWDASALVQHLFWFAFWCWLAAGFLRLLFIANTSASAQPAANRHSLFTLGITEISVVLGSLNLMFAVFVALQFRYLFSLVPISNNDALNPYSDYARRGFFELVTVAALLLPVLLAAHAMLRKDNAQHERIFRPLAGLLVLLMFVIMASALQRMGLYTRQLGLTELRIYTTAFMLWLGLVFAWFVCTVLIGKPNHFVFGALCAGFAMIAVLIALNPDDFIVRTNVARAVPTGERMLPRGDVLATNDEGRYDSDYAVHLSFSADAVPALIQTLPQLEPKDSCRVAAVLLEQWSPLPPDESWKTFDWRTFHWSRYTAQQQVGANLNMLKTLACPDGSSSNVVPEAPLLPASAQAVTADLATPEDEVLLHVFIPSALVGTDQQTEALSKLESDLTEACRAKTLCYLLGSNSLDNAETVFYLFGADADPIIDVIAPVVRASPLATDSFAVKRYLSTDKGLKSEVVVRIDRK